MNTVAALLLSLIGTDRLGDPTPPGTLARYGTTRLCAEREQRRAIRFHPTHEEVYLIPNARLPVFGWALPSGAVCFREPAASGPVTDLHFDPSGRFRLLVRSDLDAEIWDHATGRRLRSVSLPNPLSRPNSVCGFTGDVLAVATIAATGFSARGELRVLRRNQLWSASGPMDRVSGGSVGTLSRTGDRLCLADKSRNEVRHFHSATGGLAGWRPLPVEPDTDLDSDIHRTSDGRRFVAIQTRQDEKADRYRGVPECFVQVFDTASNRVESRYTFRLDDTGNGERLNPSQEREGGHAFGALTPSDDGQFLAWVDHSRRLRIRHLTTGRVVTAAGEYDGRLYLAFSPNGKRLAVDDLDGILRLVDPHTGRFQHLADSPATAAKCAAVSPDGKLVATGHACGEVWVWDAATGKPLWHTEPDGHIWELRFSKDGTTLAAIGAWPALATRTFDAASGKPRGPQLRCASVLSVALTAGGKHLIDTFQPDTTGPERPKGTVLRVLEVATGNELRRTPLDHPVGYVIQKDAVVSADGRVIAVMHADGQAFAYDTATGKKRCRLVATKDGATNGRLAVSADGRLVAQFGYAFDPLVLGSGWLTVFDTERDGAIIFDGDPGGVVNGVAFSPDGRYLLAIAGESGRSVLCDLRSRATIRRWARAESALFPDGKTALALPGIRGAERLSLEPLAWKVAPPPKPDAARLKQLWTRLGEPDAMAAVFELARFPADAVPFLTAKLLAEPPDPKAVAAHVGDLGAKLYADREAATKALQALGPETLPALRAARKAETSPEARRRLDKLIAGHADPSVPFTLARLRAVEVLERCGTADGRAVLKGVAARAGTPWADDAAHGVERK